MRSRKEIEADGTRVDMLMLEVLLDVRELLTPSKEKARTEENKPITKTRKPRGRPPKKKKVK